MDVSKFNHEYLTDILKKIKNENKNIILMGDFNVNLIKCSKNRGAYEFLEQLSNHNFTPQITLSTIDGFLFQIFWLFFPRKVLLLIIVSEGIFFQNHEISTSQT